MLALNHNPEQERRRFRRSCYSAAFALAGFLDIALCCRILANLSFTRSVLWGLVAAACYALAYLALSYASEFLGDDPEGDAAAQVLRDDEEDDDDDEERGTWLEELGWKLLAWAIIAVSTVGLFLIFNAKSIVVILCFAAVTAGVSGTAVMAVIVISGTIQLVAMNCIIIPLAKQRGISL